MYLKHFNIIIFASICNWSSLLRARRPVLLPCRYYIYMYIFEKNSFWKLCTWADLLHKTITVYHSRRPFAVPILCVPCLERAFRSHFLQWIWHEPFGWRTANIEKMHSGESMPVGWDTGILRVWYFQFSIFCLFVFMNFVEWNSDPVGAIDTAYLHSLQIACSNQRIR